MFVGFVVILAMFTPVVLAAQASQGYVAYRLVATGPTNSYTVTLNESVEPSHQPNLSVVTLSLFSNNWNLSYSRTVNSSIQLFPYLPTLANQSIAYSYKGYSIRLSLQRSGTNEVSFNGEQYQVTNYEFFASINSTTHIFGAAGNVSTMPSGLIYSVNAVFNQTEVISFQLIATSIPLNDPASLTRTTAMTAAGMVSVAAAAVALPWGIRRRKRPTEPPMGSKPLHWVD
jgi:hypothetical protein